MVAGIELGKKYAQVCVRAESFFVPRECGMEDREGMEKLFRKLLKLIRPYGNPENLRSLVFALEENTEKERNFLREMAECYNVSPECLCFMDYKESFCTYLFHQPAELLVHNALLIDNIGGEQRMFLLHRRSGTIPAAAEVYDLSGEKPEDVLAAHAISSVFLLGDFTEEWKEKYLKLLKRGRRVFAGNNLYVKGAYFKGEELSEKKESGYCYLGEEKLQCNIALRGGNDSLLSVAEAGKNWYEADNKFEVLLLGGNELEFVFLSVDGKVQKKVTVSLGTLPERPKKTTRLQISLKFSDTEHMHYRIKDLGFGEIFPPSDIVCEGELQWEQ